MARSIEERRKYLRLRVYHLVKYRVISDKPSHSAFSLSSIRDIGAGGVCLVIEKQLPVSTKLELEINFPDIGGSILTSGRVVWVKQVAKTSRYMLGIEFTGIDEALRKRIDTNVRFVYQKLKTKDLQISKAVR
jgi:c-di-GMP-binding flagellar brake protein YcgR